MDATEPLRRAARRWPTRDALRSGTERVAFAALDARVNRLARLLGRRGVRRGDRIATLLQNSIAHVVAQMAILRAGGVWVAINRRLAPAEIGFMLAHSGSAVLLTDGDGLPAGTPAAGLATVLDVSGHDAEVERALAGERAEPPDLVLGERDVARLRYTSGTTGEPKAAVLLHASPLASLRTLLGELHEFGPDDVVLHVAPLTHASEALVAPAFWRGATSVIAPRFDAAELPALIARERVTTVFLVPTMIAALLEGAGSAADLAPLRTVVYGAAPIGHDLLARALALLGPVWLQIYGMSECPFPITTLRKADHLEPSLRATCGLPTAASEVRIVGDDGQPVAAGEVGRIAVRGPQMMREYWNDPAATAACLLDGWLVSGDIGRLDAAGFLTLVDRMDDVIISGGFNIYPREVECALESHPAVAEAAIAAVPHARWGEGVGAWVVRRPGATVSAEELIAHCRARLAGYKKPVHVAFVDALPRSSTGKLLRRMLRTTKPA